MKLDKSIIKKQQINKFTLEMLNLQIFDIQLNIPNGVLFSK